MSLLDVHFVSNAFAPARCVVDRLGRVGYSTPYMLSIVENTVNSGTFNRIYPLGLAAPNAAPVASVGAAGALTGDYAWIIVFVDSARNVIGAVSATSNTITLTADRATLDFSGLTNAVAVERADQIYIYRNLAGVTTFFFVAAVDKETLSYTDNSSDNSISANDELPLSNAAPATNTYGGCVTHKGFPFLFGPYNQVGNTEYDDDFIWGGVGDPDNYPLVNRTKIDRGLGGPITAAGSNGDDLVFYKRSRIYILQFDTNPSGTTGDGYGKVMNTERGCLNIRTMVNVQGIHYVLDQQGIYEHRGMGDVTELAQMPLAGLWSRINWAQAHKFSGAWDDDICVWYVALDRDTECRFGIYFDLKAYRARREIRWAVLETDFGVRDMVRMKFASGSKEVQYGVSRKSAIAVFETYGYTGFLNAGYTDMASPDLTVRATVTGGSTTTVVASAATFSASNDNGDSVSVLGCYGRFPDWETFTVNGTSADWRQAYRITGVSGTTLTVSPAMPAAPPVGAIFEIGGIKAVIDSPDIDFGAPSVEKTAGNLIVEYQRMGIQATAKVRFRRDQRGFETNARTVSESQLAQTVGRDYTTFNMGGSIEAGGKGIVELGPPAGRFRRIQFQIDMSGVSNPGIIDALTLEPGK